MSTAAEAIDSRWTGYRFRLPDVLADNTSAAGVVVGAGPIDLTQITDLSSLACVVEVGGEVVHRATGAAILGDPCEPSGSCPSTWRAVARCCRPAPSCSPAR